MGGNCCQVKVGCYQVYDVVDGYVECECEIGFCIVDQGLCKDCKDIGVWCDIENKNGGKKVDCVFKGYVFFVMKKGVDSFFFDILVRVDIMFWLIF